MTLQTGRPSDTNRDAAELSTYDYLDALGMTYQRVDHPAAATMEDCLAIDRVLGCEMCKNLFLCNRQGTVFYLLLMPGDKPFRTKELSAQIGSARLSFASPEAMERYLGLHPGAVSVMGLKNDKAGDVQLLIDEDLLQKEWLGCHPCVNTSSLKLKTEDVLRVFLPATAHEYRTVKLGFSTES